MTQIPGLENRQADAISKLASMNFDHLSKKDLVEVLPSISIYIKETANLEEETPNWMKPYYDFIQHIVLPGDYHEARKIRIKAPQFAILRTPTTGKATLHRVSNA